MKKIIMILLLLISVGMFTFADELLRVPYPMTLRQRGMGDAFTAVSDDYYLMFTNPAGLGEKKNLEVKEDGGIVQVPPLNILAGASTDVVNSIPQIEQLIDSFSSSDTESQLTSVFDTMSLVNRSNIGVIAEELIIPFGYVGKNFGFNAFPTSIDVSLSPVISLQPHLYLNVAAYSQIMFGFSPINFDLAGEDNFHIGFGLKAMGVGLFEATVGIGEAISWMENESEALEFLSSNIYAGPGFGLNIGALWALDNGLRFGLSVSDAPSVFFLADLDSPTESVAFNKVTWGYPNLRAGVAYQLNLPRLISGFPEWFMDNILVAFDMNNIIDPRYGLWAKTHLGMSFNLIRTGIFGLNFSGGLNKGYLTFSSTVKLLIFEVSYCYYQDEAGIAAGDFPVGYHMVSLNMRW